MTASPEDYGVIIFDENNNPVKIIEKPKNSKDNIIVTGIYAYTNDVIERSKKLKKSSRNEIEISDLNNAYLTDNNLNVKFFGRGISWFDAGNPDRILEVSNFIQLIEKNQGNLVGCLEEIAYKKGYITEELFKKSIDFYKNSKYGDYLKKILD